MCLPSNEYIIIIVKTQNKMSSRYQTLNVSLQTDNHRNDSRLSQTIDNANNQDDDQVELPQSDERVKKFRQLYFRNQKLRKQLKILNSKLNEKLQKVKFPSVKKRAASVDLNHHPPNKALQRELENAYKQVKMYKKQIQILKIKEESQQNYVRLRDMENMVLYRDKEIAEIQQQLISARSIKKMQEKIIISDLENDEVKQRLEQYQREHKQLRDKLKAISRKSRKRQQQYKKQQAYSVSLQKKMRLVNQAEKNQNEEQEAVEIVRPEYEVTEKQFQAVKNQIVMQKKHNDEILKKIEASKKYIDNIKRQQTQKAVILKEKDAWLKTLQTKLMAVNRLLREQQRKQREQQQPNKLYHNVDEMSDQLDNDSDSLSDDHQESNTLEGMLYQLNGASGGEGRTTDNNREWKGKLRKVQHGFGGPNDKKYQYQGQLIGFHACLDQNQSICGISFIFISGNKQEKQSQFLGNKSSVELKWVVNAGDQICKISGSFTQQSYLNQIIVSSKKGKTGVFGAASTDPFMFILNQDEIFNGCFGSIRELGNDKRLTQFGFWVQKQE